VTFTVSGKIHATVVTKYSDGTIIDRQSKSMDALVELTLAERGQLTGIITKLLNRV